MLPNQNHFALAAQLNRCATVTEQAALIAQAIHESINAASIGTAQALGDLINSTPLPDDMPLVSWPGAQRIAARICERYAQHLQSGTDEIPEESAKPAHRVTRVEMERDARGFWRHPLYPIFNPNEPASRTVWFAVNGLDGCGTFLIAPEGQTTSDDYSAWELKRPAGDKWFLLAIEPTDNGPVAVWGAPVGDIG